jgi:hypothetical protein
LSAVIEYPESLDIVTGEMGRSVLHGVFLSHEYPAEGREHWPEMNLRSHFAEERRGEVRQRRQGDDRPTYSPISPPKWLILGAFQKRVLKSVWKQPNSYYFRSPFFRKEKRLEISRNGYVELQNDLRQ